MSCECGCGEAVSPGRRFVHGHSRRGVKLSTETRAKMARARSDYYRGRRLRDREGAPGLGVYSTKEYQDARVRLVEGKPCFVCGAEDQIHAHHVVPGDDRSLIPLCAVCHVRAHHGIAERGRAPPPNETAPLCACGCGSPVSWKRVRGWARFRKGHGGAKVPGNVRLGPAPLCACGCGKPTSYRYGRGWCEFKRGHDQRVHGAHRWR